ncbi:MAG TPA: OsmC family protein [Bacteroidales bacterium]|nr:OsmC family protein [Bacteroidales bacterium]
MKESISLSWLSEMSFEADINGHKVYLDASPDHGGKNMGPRPKPFMLLALGGCTGMDVVSILGKMRVEFDSLNIRVEGNLTEEHPKHFDNMKVIYEFSGKGLSMDKLQKAVDLSKERYCGVSANYRESMDLEYEVRII